MQALAYFAAGLVPGLLVAWLALRELRAVRADGLADRAASVGLIESMRTDAEQLILTERTAASERVLAMSRHFDEARKELLREVRVEREHWTAERGELLIRAERERAELYHRIQAPDKAEYVIPPGPEVDGPKLNVSEDDEIRAGDLLDERRRAALVAEAEDELRDIEAAWST